MKIFVADNNNKIRQICRENNIGILSSPHYFRPIPKDIDYILDNGAFKAYSDNTEWYRDLFYKTIDRLIKDEINPYFIVIPDIVGDGKNSIRQSKDNIYKIPKQFKKYFCVQDGMTKSDIIPFIKNIDGIFIGGTVEWKWKYAHFWCEFAHENNIKCHIGRVGTLRNYNKAYICGADSVDGSGPSRNNRMDIPIKFLKIMNEQQSLI